jgi:hypothetical protein
MWILQEYPVPLVMTADSSGKAENNAVMMYSRNPAFQAILWIISLYMCSKIMSVFLEM